ncbi:Hypothetical predicted protein [Cloeon dipterum]|uniref:Uncharacterized protein n=1 Tax=Cloeon dipterum TaxID=197152 RepID=A0A8S1DE34_9INSE|nr:Hypothetical predicted protein [Cloeon dipterum]
MLLRQPLQFYLGCKMGDFGENFREIIDQERPMDESSELSEEEENIIPLIELGPSISLEMKLVFVLRGRADIPAILYAAKIGDLEICKELVKLGEDFNETDEEGNDVYHYAALNKTYGEQLIYYFKDLEEHSECITGGLQLLKDLFEDEASLFKTDNGRKFNTDILTKAAGFSDLDTFMWIMKVASNFDKNLVRSKKWQLRILQTTFLNIDHGDKIASFMVESKESKVTKEDLISIIKNTMASGFPFLNNDVLGLFKSHGVDLESVFTYCLSKNFLDTAQYLHDLEPQEIDSTLLYYAAGGSGVEMIEWLLELNPALELDEHILHAALKNVKYGTKIIDYFTEKLGEHINSVNEEGKTPLHVAVDNFNLPVFETLLKIGADLSVKYKDWNMLIYCLTKNFVTGAKIVYDKDAEQLEGANKRLALYCAQEDKEIEEWLQSKSFIPKPAKQQTTRRVRDAAPTTLFFILQRFSLKMEQYPRETSDSDQERESSGNEELELFKFNPHASLKEKLEFVEFVNKKRGDHAVPPILAAAELADVEVCEELVKQGADVNVTDKYGNDVYHSATFNALNTRERGLELIDFFKDHGAKMERRNNIGLDAVTIALRFSEFEFAIKLFNYYESPESSKSFISHCILQDVLFLKFAFEEDPSVFKVKNSDEIDRRITYEGASSANLEKFEWIVEVASRIDEDLVKSREWQLEILHYAARNVKYGEAIARFMLSDHIKNGVTREESTDLIVRVMSSDSLEMVNFEVVKMLVQLGANMNVRIQGRTLLDHCVAKGSKRAAQFVFNQNPRQIGLSTFCVAAKNSEMCKWLVDRFNGPNMVAQIPFFLDTFFQMKMEGGPLIKTFASLVGPLVNKPLAMYYPALTPLEVAMKNENLGAAEALLEIGADLSASSNLLLYCLGINFLEGAKFVYARDRSQLQAGRKMDIAMDLANTFANEEMENPARLQAGAALSRASLLLG